MSDAAGQDPTPGAGQGGEGGQDPNPADGGTKPKGQDPEGGDGGKPKPQLDEKALRAELKRARAEAAEARTANKATAKTLDALRKALGVDGGEDDNTPEGLAKQVKTLAARLNAAEGRNAFTAAAAEAGADADLAFAVLKAAGDLEDVDYTDQKGLVAMIKKAVKDNPKLAAGEPKRVGTGDPGSGGDAGTNDMNSWIRKQAGF